jgi:hypothetical protein
MNHNRDSKNLNEIQGIVLVMEVMVIQLILAITVKVMGCRNIFLSILTSYNSFNRNKIRIPIMSGSPGKLTANPKSVNLIFSERGVVMIMNHKTLSSEKR